MMTTIHRPTGAATRRRCAAVLAIGALAAALTAPAPVTAAPATDPPAVVNSAGADLVAVTLDGATLSLVTREVSGPDRKPATAVFGPAGGVAVRTPDHPAFRFLGPAGRPMWALTGSDVEFPYLDTRAVPRGAVRGDTIELSLRQVDGPGGFVAYTLGGLGQPTPLFGTLDAMPRTARLPAATRTGGLVWLFDAAGEYRLTLSAAATLANGAEVTADADYRVLVPRLDEAPPDPADTRPVPAPAPAPAADLARASGAAPGDGVPLGADSPSDGTPARALAAAAAPTATSTASQLAAAAQQDGSRVVIDDGHVDMGPELTGADWTIRLKDDTVSPPVWRDLSDVVLHVKDNAKITVPDNADFLGAPGDEVWLLPQGQRAGIVWPGWNTQHPSVVAGVRGPVVWTFTGVDGPGRFALFLTGSFGESEVLFDSSARLPQRLDIPINTHAHGNWAFSEPGIYRLAFEMSATTSSGSTLTDSRSLTVAIGDATDPDTGFGPGGDDNPGGGSGDGRLPRTGSSWHLPATGAILVIAGALVLFATRRRRPAQCSS
ncbi:MULTISPECIES: TIGR03773 family transporter-associated surface protein [unclassified Solwaraspora]|uniref:TIGR03773 family transporter-associated surface protein n=1 Tax=unclassified Solwaraspora TaxID=2627926 RepID=UPI00248BA965|nr:MULTISPECIES: TIGR03773 family transporter-associated surface protein [unclassified Solwaraspora]WBB95850.1 TIGR03773 family transporter-associated surface protein [Solwaraspora sp. WMMA2059]WBC20246.1 TIGR03773 family transporter-associated surface protein [Solwaraspora sp. WMMA2080]WJK32169.1 TIGR03773 family transporter-associated surface protein [Solwaraspora sp. WMMA2065]